MPRRRPDRTGGESPPPICPACGVTMGIVVAADGSTRFVCLECGFDEESGSPE